MTQVKPPILLHAGKFSSSSSDFLSSCTISISSFFLLFLLHLLHHFHFFLIMFLQVSPFSPLLYLQSLNFFFFFQDLLEMMVTSDAWQQSYPLPVLGDDGDSPGDPLDDDGLGGAVLGLPGQH